MEKPKSIIIFGNGNVAAFDDKGHQIGELQKGWFQIWLEWLEANGVDPTTVKIETMFRNYSDHEIKPFKTEDGRWNSY